MKELTLENITDEDIGKLTQESGIFIIKRITPEKPTPEYVVNDPSYSKEGEVYIKSIQTELKYRIKINPEFTESQKKLEGVYAVFEIFPENPNRFEWYMLTHAKDCQELKETAKTHKCWIKFGKDLIKFLNTGDVSLDKTYSNETKYEVYFKINKLPVDQDGRFSKQKFERMMFSLIGPFIIFDRHSHKEWAKELKELRSERKEKRSQNHFLHKIIEKSRAAACF